MLLFFIACTGAYLLGYQEHCRRVDEYWNAIEKEKKNTIQKFKHAKQHHKHRSHKHSARHYRHGVKA